jgi:hypothetical protein
MYKMNVKNKKIFISSILMCVIFTASLFPLLETHAQIDEITWSQELNISNSLDFTSTDPFLLADPAGRAHIFWAEKVSSGPGNQPDTLMYAMWDGTNWSIPIDIFYSPASRGSLFTIFPHAAIDNKGQIHLIWLEQPNYPNNTLLYSRSHSSEAGSARNWSSPITLSEDPSATKYSIDIASASNGDLHVVFARVRQGFSPPEDRAVSYMKSTDGGISWSVPIDLYSIPDPYLGASDTRLLLGPNEEVYVTWTVWDESGNGKYVSFVRSLDSGESWERPIKLSETVGDEYERDWTQLALLGRMSWLLCGKEVSCIQACYVFV